MSDDAWKRLENWIRRQPVGVTGGGDHPGLFLLVAALEEVNEGLHRVAAEARREGWAGGRAEGFARAREQAEGACTATIEVYADCQSPEQVAVRDTAKALRERICAMQDDGDKGVPYDEACGCDDTSSTAGLPGSTQDNGAGEDR